MSMFCVGVQVVLVRLWCRFCMDLVCLSMKTTRFVDYICYHSTLFVHLQCFRIAGNLRKTRERKSEGLAQLCVCPGD